MWSLVSLILTFCETYAYAKLQIPVLALFVLFLLFIVTKLFKRLSWGFVMIDSLLFIVGFVVYLVMAIVTFDAYSRKEGMTNKYVLFLIYIYYTVLAGYVISFVDKKAAPGDVLYEIIVYAVLGGILFAFYYREVIRKRDIELLIDVKRV